MFAAVVVGNVVPGWLVLYRPFVAQSPPMGVCRRGQLAAAVICWPSCQVVLWLIGCVTIYIGTS